MYKVAVWDYSTKKKKKELLLKWIEKHLIGSRLLVVVNEKDDDFIIVSQNPTRDIVQARAVADALNDLNDFN